MGIIVWIRNDWWTWVGLSDYMDACMTQWMHDDEISYFGRTLVFVCNEELLYSGRTVVFTYKAKIAYSGRTWVFAYKDEIL